MHRSHDHGAALRRSRNPDRWPGAVQGTYFWGVRVVAPAERGGRAMDCAPGRSDGRLQPVAMRGCRLCRRARNNHGVWMALAGGFPACGSAARVDILPVYGRAAVLHVEFDGIRALRSRGGVPPAASLAEIRRTSPGRSSPMCATPPRGASPCLYDVIDRIVPRATRPE